jgi:hypothetical protein
MKRLFLVFSVVALSVWGGSCATGGEPPPTPSDSLDVETAARFATLALDCVHREYPNKIAHVLQSDADARPPRELTPAFYGCFDWHSAVHGHWLLARLARRFPSTELERNARQALARSLTPENIAGEVRYLEGEGRATFERPYGLAWLLQLAAELAAWQDADAQRWSATLEPLEQAVAARLAQWLPKLSYPIRVGEHSQTAFAFGLALDWARERDRRDLAELIESRTRELYLADRACPIDYEPSGQDFLSPCLAEADLDGLNLSRAWMLQGIAAGLPASDPRRSGLLASAQTHASSGLASVRAEHYEGGHWLASFAVYLVTRRGIGP